MLPDALQGNEMGKPVVNIRSRSVSAGSSHSPLSRGGFLSLASGCGRRDARSSRPERRGWASPIMDGLEVLDTPGA
jgi:hypothetical protein